MLRTCVFLRHPYISAAQLRLGACANGSHTEQNCLDATTNGWWDDPCSDNSPSICSVPTTTTLTTSTQVVFTSENISTTPAIQVRWVSQPSSEDEDGSRGVTGAQNNYQSNLTSAKQIPGFKISWEVRGKTKEISKSESIWRKINEHSSKKNNVNLFTIASLVRESKIKGIRESEVWKTLLKHRWDIDFLKTNAPCLDENQMFEVIYKTAQNLKINYGYHWISEEALRLGTELFSAIHYCPENLIEAAKLSKLFESLITDENLNTMVAATMHNIQPRAGDNIKDFTAINMWYQRLDERYNFSIDSVLLPLLNSKSLAELGMLDPPFMKNIEKTIDAKRSAVIGKI